MSVSNNVRFLAGLALLTVLSVHGQAQKLRILQYTYTNPGASRHWNVMDAAEAALKQQANARNWESFRTEDPAYFTDANLAKYDVIFFDNVCCASIFTDQNQRSAVEKFMRSGKGYVGSHAATASEPGWNFWVGLNGGVSNNGHPDPAPGTARVEDQKHYINQGLARDWALGNNEWFQYNKPFPASAKVKVLVSLPKGSVVSGHTFTEDLPVSWCSYYNGARGFYSSLGHFPTAFTDPQQRDHFFRALEWAGGRGPQTGACGEPVTTGLRKAQDSGGGKGGARVFAERFFSIRSRPGGVSVTTLEPGGYRLELFDGKGARVAAQSGRDARMFNLDAGRPGVYVLRAHAGSQAMERRVSVME